MSSGSQFHQKRYSGYLDIHIRENSSFSSRLSPGEPVNFWGRFRSWYPYRGYGRTFYLKQPSLFILPLPSERISIGVWISGVIFFILPVVLFPLYPEIGRRFYPGFPFLVHALRPPTPVLFFREMYIFIISGAAIVFIQMLLGLILLRNKKFYSTTDKIHWGEAGIVGWLLSMGFFGLLRGFQTTSLDSFFFPAPVLGAAILAWLLISGIILFSPVNNKPGPQSNR